MWICLTESFITTKIRDKQLISQIKLNRLKAKIENFDAFDWILFSESDSFKRLVS